MQTAGEIKNREEYLTRTESEESVLSDAGSGDGKEVSHPDQHIFDRFKIDEEKDRSNSISDILRFYRDSYRSKVDFQIKYRKILFWGCGTIIIAFSIAMLVILWYAIYFTDRLDLTSVAGLITATVALVVSILELVHIMTKYCFPDNDEEYIVKIVESVQSNDLEKYKETNRSTEAREKKKDGTALFG